MLRKALLDLRAIREEEYQQTNKSYHYYFFSKGLGISYEDKIAAINKMVQALDGHPVIFNMKDTEALNNARLRKVMLAHQSEWPKCYRQKLADDERADFESNRNTMIEAALMYRA